MHDQIIKCVNAIGEQEGQDPKFRFTNCRQELYKWTNEVPEDDLEFQGLLNNDKEMAVYPDISVELPGVELEEDAHKHQTVIDEPEADFCDPTNAALHNAGINADNAVQAAQAWVAAEVDWHGPALAEADEDKIVYKLIFDLPDAGLPPPMKIYRSPLETTGTTQALRPSLMSNKEQCYLL